MHDEDNDGGFPGKSPVEVPLLDVLGGAVDRALVISMTATCASASSRRASMSYRRHQPLAQLPRRRLARNR